ncbi:MAG: hypothetical protein NTX39_03070, partial [Opitutae bacterium]|nr:hypothetical protein [Opitutae bacterium]
INLSLFGFDIKMRVVDDEARPVTEAHAGISFVMYRQGTDVENDGMTDKNGFFGANGAAKHSVYIEANKPGHYEARVDRLPKDKDLDLTVVIPRIIQPIPLYARRADAVIPTQNEWLGYDFEIGDWVAPIGLGKVTDIRFKFRNEFKGWRLSDKNMVHSRQVNSTSTEEEIRNFYGKWDGELEISFPAAKEGLFEELRFLKYSQLKLPHRAPLEGYGPTWRYTDNSYSPPTTREQVGFFLRTRVKLDAQGNIISAHYTKIMGDIRLAAQGSLHFTYYFNPTVNDRNLEFDPTKNLFSTNHPGAYVIDP